MESIFLEFCAHCKRKTAHKILPFLFPPVARCRRVKQRCIVRFYKKGARRFPQRRMWSAFTSLCPISIFYCAQSSPRRAKNTNFRGENFGIANIFGAWLLFGAQKFYLVAEKGGALKFKPVGGVEHFLVQAAYYFFYFTL